MFCWSATDDFPVHFALFHYRAILQSRARARAVGPEGQESNIPGGLTALTVASTLPDSIPGNTDPGHAKS